MAPEGFRRFERFDLRGRTLRFTVDLSHVPCGTLAALYFVAGNTGQHADVYCDMHTPEPCTEIDLFEGNKWALQTTVHTRTGSGPDGTCNEWGCTVNVGNWPRTRESGRPPLPTRQQSLSVAISLTSF